MGGLAEALIQLSSAARGRREARKSMRESVETVARAIAQHLRVGDTVAVGSATYTYRNLSWFVAAKNDDDYHLSVDCAPVLCRGNMALYDARFPEWNEYGDDPKPTKSPGDTAYVVRSSTGPDDDDFEDEYVKHAGDATRKLFVEEAEDVAAAFVELLDDDTEFYAKAARSITKAAPR